MKNDALVENKSSLKVIKMLDERKKSWVDLEEDLDSIAKKMKRIEVNCQQLPYEKKTLGFVCDLLVLQHQATYYAFMNGLENMIEYYLDKKNDEYFYKLLSVRDLLSNRCIHTISLVRSNGFYIQLSDIAPSLINPSASLSDDYNSFKQSLQTVIDEKCLIPR